MNRNYNFKDVDMLLASKTITQSLKDNLTDLSIARSNWGGRYVDELAAKIDDAIENSPPLLPRESFAWYIKSRLRRTTTTN